MTSFLIRCFPARWRDRYGDEFEAILEERPLGPFDVADILLAAIDAHLHLRGIEAASQRRRGFMMSLRLGGSAAILGGVLFLGGLLASSIDQTDDGDGPWTAFLFAGTAALLLELLPGAASSTADLGGIRSPGTRDGYGVCRHRRHGSRG